MPLPEAPFLVTLGFDRFTFERLDGLRSRYFPPDRNMVPAHISLFHQLPGDQGESIRSTLDELAGRSRTIPLRFPGIKKMGRGVLMNVEAPKVLEVHKSLARSFGQWLTTQDRQPFRPHVTIMNKAEKTEAEAAFEELQSSWLPWSGTGDRLILWRYLGGPWEEIASYDLAGEPLLETMSLETSQPEG